MCAEGLLTTKTIVLESEFSAIFEVFPGETYLLALIMYKMVYIGEEINKSIQCVQLHDREFWTRKICTHMTFLMPGLKRVLRSSSNCHFVRTLNNIPSSSDFILSGRIAGRLV